MGLREDAARLLVYMNDHKDPHGRGRGVFEGPPLMAALDLTPQDLNDAVDLLEENGYVETSRYLGTHPFRFKDVALTPLGRVEAERLQHEGDEAPPPGAIDRSPTPIGSPFGFQDEDWESVERDRSDGLHLIVVFGHQWNSALFDTDVLRENVGKMMNAALADAIDTIPGRPAVVLDYRPLKGGYGGHVFNEIARDIIGADIAVFDTSDFNSNVMIELGVALTWGTRVLPIRENSTPIPPSDISGQTWTTYTDSGASWTDPDHHKKLVSLVARALRKKLAATKR